MSNTRRLARSAHRLHASGQDQDARYFNTNPQTRSYRRPATPAELRAAQLPPGTQVQVRMLGATTRVRAFIPPDERRN